jgi:hypothetical protein
MLVLRLAGMIAALVVGAGVVAFLFTRERRYLSLAWRVTKYAMIVVMVILALLVLERIVVL